MTGGPEAGQFWIVSCTGPGLGSGESIIDGLPIRLRECPRVSPRQQWRSAGIDHLALSGDKDQPRHFDGREHSDLVVDRLIHLASAYRKSQSRRHLCNCHCFTCVCRVSRQATEHTSCAPGLVRPTTNLNLLRPRAPRALTHTCRRRRDRGVLMGIRTTPLTLERDHHLGCHLERRRIRGRRGAPLAHHHVDDLSSGRTDRVGTTLVTSSTPVRPTTRSGLGSATFAASIPDGRPPLSSGGPPLRFQPKGAGRRPAMAVMSIVVVATCAALFALIYVHSSRLVAVVGVARQIPQGQMVQVGDLRQARHLRRRRSRRGPRG